MHESSYPNLIELPNEVEVLLQGGVGNQLFQLMYALNSYPGSEIVLNAQILRPRINQLGELEISTLHLPPNVSIKSGKRRFIKKYTNISFILRPLVIAQVNSNSTSKQNRFSSFLTWLFLSLYFGKFLMLDFEGRRQGRFKSAVIAGYFQRDISFSSKQIKAVEKILIHDKRSIDSSFETTKKILGVHVRNGDYKDNPGFGILSLTYYQRAIRLVSKEIEFDNVLIFTEEKKYSEELCDFLKDRYTIEIVTKHEIKSEVETIQKMAECDAFIMANSTFSWWGGLLLSDQTKVFFPAPWFKSNPGSEPSVSPNWRPVKSNFEQKA